MEIRICPRCARADVAPATRCGDCGVPLELHDERRLIGSLLGNYRLERVLGSGGMGVVFEARHQNLLRDAAIKMLQPELDAGGDGEFAQRFLREARLLATLEHPNIVGVYDFDLSTWGFPYLVMPRLRGETLRGLLARHPRGLPLAWIAAIAGDIAAGLAHAHRHGVVHRDLKPENIFLSLEADGVRAKLLDFGIAHAGTIDDLTRTATGTLMGTPLYQAPEQLRGEPVSAATDQYAFALVLAELLRGLPVRQGRTLTDILTRDVTRPLPHDALPDGIAPWISAALMQATAPAPGERFDSVGTLFKRLELPGADRDALAAAIDDGSATVPLTVVVSPPRDREAAARAAPTTPPPMPVQAPRTPAPGTATRRPRRALVAGIVTLALVGVVAAFGFWRSRAPDDVAPAAPPAAATWLREAERLPLPPGMRAPIADRGGNLVLRTASGWSLFDVATRSIGANAALGVAERLLGVDDRGRLWLAHDGAVEALDPDDNERTTLFTDADALRGDDAQVRWSLAASGRWLARLDPDGRFRVFRLRDGKVETWIDAAGAADFSTQFTIADRYAVIVRPTKGVEAFALDARRSAWHADFGAFRVRSLALDETLDRVAVLGDGERVGVWRLADGAPVAAPKPEAGRELRAALWIADGARLLTADGEALTLWRWRDGAIEAAERLPGGADWLYRGLHAVYAGSERELRRYDFGPTPARTLATGVGETWALAADADAAYVGGSKNGDVVRANPAGGEPRRGKVHNAGITDLQLFHDKLVSSSDDRTIAVWKLPELELEWRAKGHEFLVNQLAPGTSLWSSSSDGSLRRWRWPELEPAESIDLRRTIDPHLELHGLRAFGDDELLAGTWNRLLVHLRRTGKGWDARTAPFESTTGYRLVPLADLDAVLVIGINPGRLAIVDRGGDRGGDRVETLPRDGRTWHAGAAGSDGRTVWLGGDAQIARLRVMRRGDGRFVVATSLKESSAYGVVGAMTLMPGKPGEAAALVLGDERGTLTFETTEGFDEATTTVSEAAEGFK